MSAIYTGQQLGSPTGVTPDANGDVTLPLPKLFKETPSGSGYTQSIIDSGLGGGVDEVAVDASGNLYVADPTFQRVVKETLSAGVYTQSTIVSEISYPYGAAVDGRGNVYFAVSYSGFPKYSSVLKENFSIPPSEIFAATAVGSTSVDSPHTVTVQNVGTSALTFFG